MKKNKSLGQEYFFQKEFERSYNNILPGCKLLYVEKPLYPAYAVLERDVHELIPIENKFKMKPIGRIDLVIKYKQYYYAVECKYFTFNSNEFWQALKIIGYTKYFNWQQGKENKNLYKPAVMIPINKIKLEHRIVATSLSLTIFGVYKKNNQFFVKKINNEEKYN